MLIWLTYYILHTSCYGPFYFMHVLKIRVAYNQYNSNK